MKSTFKTLFYLKKNEPKKNGHVVIMVRITVDGDQVQFSSKLDIHPDNWDTKAGRAVINKQSADKKENLRVSSLNKTLDEIRSAITMNFLYNYNNGRLAVDPKTACQNFINAFDSIPRLIEKYTRDNEAIEKELPVLEQVVGEVWKKEDELKQLKADLAALDRKILLSLKSVDAQEKSTDGVIEVVPSQPVTPDGQDNAPAAGIPVADASPGSPSPGSVPTQDTPPAEPYVHRMPDFLADRQRTPPKLSGMPKSISIKEAMGALGGKLVIGGIPKSGNKDDPDPDRPEKPKPKLKL